MRQVLNAVNRCAHWLEHIIGRSTVFETLSYMGLPDLRYAIFFLAAVKCGYKVRRNGYGTSYAIMHILIFPASFTVGAEFHLDEHISPGADPVYQILVRHRNFRQGSRCAEPKERPPHFYSAVIA